jgi:protein-tyrosine phosphatase
MDPDEIGSPATILSLCESAGGHPSFGGHRCHLPAPDREQTYDARCRETRKWLRRVFAALADPTIRCPVLIHCTSGKDRTGVVVALLLVSLAIPAELALREYLLSEGISDVRGVKSFLEEVQRTHRYLGSVEVGLLRDKFMGT